MLEPKLINRYFWLLDYYSFQNKNKDYIQIYLDKLKDLNTFIYKKYEYVLENLKLE